MKEPFEPLGTTIRGPKDFRYEVPLGVDAYELARVFNEAFYLGLDELMNGDGEYEEAD